MDLHERIQQFKDALDELEKAAKGDEERELEAYQGVKHLEHEFEHVYNYVLQMKRGQLK